MSDQLSKMIHLQHQLRPQLRRDPGVAERAEAMGVTSEKIQQVSKEAQAIRRLRQPEIQHKLRSYLSQK
jgi:DNA-directed RNA polymerase sigma subunit (sigma70/sigma32)